MRGCSGMARPSFARGMLILNSILVPLAVISLYMVYRGKHGGGPLLLWGGILLGAASPFVAAALAYTVASRLYRR